MKDGQTDIYRLFERTNPNAVYDYYTTGYAGFKLKNSEKWVNNALKKDIDFEGMFAIKEAHARADYHYVIALLGGVPTLKHTWKSLVEKFSPRQGGEPTMTRDEAIALYNAQPAVVKWNAIPFEKRCKLSGFFGSVDQFCCTEDEFIQGIHALSFGFVRDRKYTSKGDMGWWATVTNEKEPLSWDDEYKAFLDSLPDDAELTMLDCHI